MGSAAASAAPGDRRARRRPGENRRSLLVAGTVEFGLHGYAASQTSAIASRAGVSQPNVYANFSSKQELFLACVSELRVTVSGSADAALADEHALLLYQGVAALGDVSLRSELRPLIEGLRDALGPGYEAALLRAAELLRGGG